MTQKVQSHILEQYELIKKIGSGAYGHVWKAIDRKTKKIVALKKIFDAFQHATDAQRTYRQIMFLQQFNHQNIIKLYDVIKAKNDKDIYLIFQFMEIDLHSLIRQAILQQKHKQFIIYQIAKSLKYLHSAQLLHRDLKPSNILLNSECLVKLCDFGLVRSVDNNQDEDPIILTQYVATRWYRAPQILMGSHSYTKGIDIWSFGCLIAEMVQGKPIFAGTSTIDQLQKVVAWTGMPKRSDIIQAVGSDGGLSMIQNLSNIRSKGNRQNLKCSDKLLIDLINRMLQFNPKKRITIQEILQHPYISQFHNPNKEPISDKIIKTLISDNKRLSLKEYRNLIYKQIGQKQSKCQQKKKTISSQIKCQVPKQTIQYVRKKSLRTNTKQSDDQECSKSTGSTLFIKNKIVKYPFVSPTKLDMYNPKYQNKNYKTKLLTQSKQSQYSSISKSKAKSVYSSKKNSLQTHGDLFQHIPKLIKEIKKRSQSIYSNQKKTSQFLNKYLNKPYPSLL